MNFWFSGFSLFFQELKHGHGQNPLTTLSSLLPTMFGFVVFCSLLVESPWKEARNRGEGIEMSLVPAIPPLHVAPSLLPACAFLSAAYDASERISPVRAPKGLLRSLLGCA